MEVRSGFWVIRMPLVSWDMVWDRVGWGGLDERFLGVVGFEGFESWGCWCSGVGVILLVL